MLSLSVNLLGWAPQKIKCTHKIKCGGLTHFIFSFCLFVYFKGAPAPSFYLGTPMGGVYVYVYVCKYRYMIYTFMYTYTTVKYL